MHMNKPDHVHSGCTAMFYIGKTQTARHCLVSNRSLSIQSLNIKEVQEALLHKSHHMILF